MLTCGEGEYGGTDIGIKLLPCYIHSVMWVCLCIPGHIHCSCSTVMTLLCIPVSELVSFAFSTIPICPFLIQKNFIYAIPIMNELHEKKVGFVRAKTLKKEREEK